MQSGAIGDFLATAEWPRIGGHCRSGSSLYREFLPNDIDEVRRIFSRKGAYARFKDLLDRRGALDHWYDFEAKVEEKALRMWCDLNSIEVGD
jgi:hypothetical protein